MFLPGGFAPPDPLSPSLAGAPSPRAAPRARLPARLDILPGGLRPAGLPNRAAVAAAATRDADYLIGRLWSRESKNPEP